VAVEQVQRRVQPGIAALLPGQPSGEVFAAIVPDFLWRFELSCYDLLKSRGQKGTPRPYPNQYYILHRLIFFNNLSCYFLDAFLYLLFTKNNCFLHETPF